MTWTIKRIDGTAHPMPASVAPGVFDFTVREAYLTAFLANPANILVVAVVGDTVVGMATGIAYAHPDKPLQLFINEVGVDDAYRRQGIGTALVRRMLQEGALAGCREAWVATEVDNVEAIALYRSTGGEEDETKAVVFTYDTGLTLPPSAED
jgi:ribosomal protein S18 acetylase RimI-like enzyme